MAKKFLWQPQETNTKLLLRREEGSFVEADDNAELTDITAIQALGDSARTYLAGEVGMSLADYDKDLQDREWELRERLDYYSVYATRLESLTVADGAWFSPVAVDSSCGEEIGQEASKSVDGNNATFWRHATNHQHSIVYELRSYPKKISKIRFRYGAGESARERLNNMDVHASRGIANIDKPAKILETGINISWPTPGDVWVEHTLAKKANSIRYIKLVIDDTDNGSNQIQIREFEVWVETKDFGE